MASVQRTSSFLWRHSTALRAGAAAVLLLVALGSWAGAEHPADLRPVVVAARDIPSGGVIAEDDLATAQDSLGLSTPAASELVGESVRGPVAAGEPLTASRLTPGRSVPTGAGTVVFPLALADTRIADLLVAGDRVDVIVTPDSLHEGKPRTAAGGVEVLTVTAPADSGPGSALARSGSMVLLQVTAEQARGLAAIRGSDHVSVAIT